MITQETKRVKTWGGFNLTILKVKLNPLSWKNRNSYNKTYKAPHSTSYCYPPVELPRTISESTDSFFLGLTTRYKHTHLCFFRLQWQQLNWWSRCRKLLLLKNPKLVWRKTPQKSHKRFTQTIIWATLKRG